MMGRIYDFFSSLKLTIVLLAAATLLVFVGTMAQDRLGLYTVQRAFFGSLVVWWGPTGADWRLPVLPGGHLVGGLLVLNLIAAQIRNFELSKAKIGLQLAHCGVILLLLGQFATDKLTVESHMRLSEGQTLNYSESGRNNELVLVNSSDGAQQQVIAIPEARLARGGEVTHPQIPFTLRIREYYANSQPEGRAEGSAGPTNGVAAYLRFERAPETTRMDARDVPAALIEVVAGGQALGSWWVSNWIEEQGLSRAIWREASPALKRALEAPQTFTQAGHTWQLALRPMRFYKPFSLELLKFTHQKYSGTDIPKAFSSRVRLRRPDTGEDREVLIYMNNPLRYAGETFYQSGYDENDPRVTILQVVRNPGWLTPYLACLLVSLGLTYHFGLHLVRAVSQRRPS